VRDRAQQTAYQQIVRAQWESQPDRHPHRVAHYGTFAFKPPGPLAVFDPGLDSYAGRVLYLEAHRQNAANFAEAGELSSAFRLGELSLAFVLQLILPLVVIALGHRTVVDEIETGRLRLLLGQGVSLRTLAFGKLAGLAAAITPSVALGSGVSLATLLTDVAFTSDPDAVARVLTIGGVLLLNTIVWLGLTLCASVHCRTAAKAGAALVTLWVLVMIVGPRVAAVIASAKHPLPDKSSFTAAVAEDVRRHGDTHDPNDPQFARFREETLARYGVSRIEDLPVNYGAIVMTRGEELSAETFARHFAALAAKMEMQAALIAQASLLAPSLAARALSSAAAGTDLRAQLKFQREAEAYRYEFVQKLNELHRDKVPHAGDRDHKLSADYWKQFTGFRATPSPLRASLTGSGIAWIALLFWALVPLVVLVRSKSTAL
jgi:ABC-2 type transport system permease protein